MSATNLLKIIEDDNELRHRISPDGWNWLLSSLDPFHDFAHPLAGYPDLAGAPSVVLEITRTVTMSGAQLSNGYMNCFLCPYSSSVSSASPASFLGLWSTLSAAQNTFLGSPTTGGNSALALYVPPTANVVSGDMIIMTAPIVLSDTAGSATCNFTGLNPAAATLTPAVYFDGTAGVVLRHGITAPHRVIGAGFEVTNTTAPLYRSGSTVVYDSPSNWGSCDTFVTSVFAEAGAVPTNNIGAMTNCHFEVTMGPPATLDQAILMPNSKQWSAEEGAYCVAKFSSLDNKVSSATSNFGNANTAYGQESNLLVPQQFTGTNTKTLGAYQGANTNQVIMAAMGRYNCYPFNGTGAWFTGLDTSNSSFQVTVKWYLEVFPNTFFEQNLVPTTSPSAAYDPVALEVYARVVSQLPPGVPVKDNFLGLIGSAIGGLAKSAVSGIKNAIGNSGKSAVDLSADWQSSVRKFGGGTNGVIKAMTDPAHNFLDIRDMARENLAKGLPQIRANFVDEGIVEPTMENAARMYHAWFGNAPNSAWPHPYYPGEESGGATHAMASGGHMHESSQPSPPMQSHACNCPPHPTMGYSNSTGPRSNEFVGGMNLNPNHIGNFIQSSVDKGINAAVRKLGLNAPRQQPMALMYDEYDYPEASAAVQARRRAARRKRAEQVAACRAAGIIPPLSDKQVAAIEKQRAAALAKAAQAASAPL